MGRLSFGVLAHLWRRPVARTYTMLTVDHGHQQDGLATPVRIVPVQIPDLRGRTLVLSHPGRRPLGPPAVAHLI